MKKTIWVWVEQTGGGCDYSIGCGQTLSSFEVDEVTPETVAAGVGDTLEGLNMDAGDGKENPSPSRVMVFIERVPFDLDAWKREKTEARHSHDEKAQRERDEAELARLKKKLGQ